ncbi:helix-turn-helix domain-containing protein [Streptomyces sp. DSM 44915]|uniref:Helix-turn-helix domain-containing protein n=1 Tax=Streptomyces chisholmiae TaxID=3075540 RepID=A0ABU2JTV8_9ACTN|nr:helix-turn-helix domain-containing protein [Streptomyces sp. DSM 44915]MDT0268412.1 helix-turn-helix domain-containing protein [Streptomyces sp. DSM 44915]
MKGLLQRLTALDADAAAAVRVIAHYQALLAGGTVDPVTLVRSTAGLVRCPAGLELVDGRRVRFGPDGRALPGVPGHVSASVELRPAGRVWLERDGAAEPFDALVLEWMALAARVGPGRPWPAPRAADPALVERVLSEREGIEDRTRAVRLLGLHPGVPLRVLAVAADAADDAGVVAVTLLARSGLAALVRVATVGPLAAAIVQPEEGAEAPAAALRAVLAERGRERLPGGARSRGIRFGVGGAVPAAQAAGSWAQATTALRFAGGGGPEEAVVDHDALGPLALLAEVPVARLRAEPGVRALAELVERDGGALGLAALAAFCRTGSLRQAAATLHLHHSSVAARLAVVESALGWRLHQPEDRFKAQLALHAWRLSASTGT